MKKEKTDLYILSFSMYRMMALYDTLYLQSPPLNCEKILDHLEWQEEGELTFMNLDYNRSLVEFPIELVSRRDSFSSFVLEKEVVLKGSTQEKKQAIIAWMEYLALPYLEVLNMQSKEKFLVLIRGASFYELDMTRYKDPSTFPIYGTEVPQIWELRAKRNQTYLTEITLPPYKGESKYYEEDR